MKKNGKLTGGWKFRAGWGGYAADIFSTELDHFVLFYPFFNATLAFLTTIATSEYGDGI